MSIWFERNLRINSEYTKTCILRDISGKEFILRTIGRHFSNIQSFEIFLWATPVCDSPDNLPEREREREVKFVTRTRSLKSAVTKCMPVLRETVDCLQWNLETGIQIWPCNEREIINNYSQSGPVLNGD